MFYAIILIINVIATLNMITVSLACQQGRIFRSILCVWHVCQSSSLLFTETNLNLVGFAACVCALVAPWVSFSRFTVELVDTIASH